MLGEAKKGSYIYHVEKIKVMSIIEKFEQLLKSKDYKGATKIYWDRAYQYQKELHELIEKYDANDIIFDILHGYHQMGEIEDQI